MDRAVPIGQRLTRRGLLASGGFTLAAVAIGAGGSLGSAPTRKLPRVPLRRSAFARHVGEAFTLRASSRETRARLALVDDFGGGRLPDKVGSESAFVLIFHAPRHAPRLEQDVMTIRHPRLGTVDLLVSPAGTGRRGQDYTAVVDTARHPRV
jgi:hypothetical protein